MLNDIEKMLELAKTYMNNPDTCEQANEILMKVISEEPENSTAINLIGNCYASGYGVEVDADKAAKYYERLQTSAMLMLNIIMQTTYLVKMIRNALTGLLRHI